MYNKILLATDNSATALKAAEYVCGLVALNPKASVTALYVEPFSREYHMSRGIGVEIPPADEEVIASAKKNVLSNVETICKKAGVPLQSRVAIGNPAEEICAIAKAEGYDMIVMGSRGLSEVKGFFLGSVSDKVLHMAHCPVLVVRP